MRRPEFSVVCRIGRPSLGALLPALVLAGCPPEPSEPRGPSTDLVAPEEVGPADGRAVPAGGADGGPGRGAESAPQEPGPETGGGGRVERCRRMSGEPPRVEDYDCPVDCPDDEASCRRLEVALALALAELDQAERRVLHGPEHPEVEAGARVIAALTEQAAELAARGWPLDADALRLRLEREMAAERLAVVAVAAERLPQHPDLVRRRARVARLQELLDALAVGRWP